MRSAIITTAIAVAVAACSSTDSGSSDGKLTVSISGESVSISGFAFPPTSTNDVAFVDGWDVKFDRVLVTVDAITLSDTPDLSPSDQSLTGPVLTTAHGPWVVDLAKPGAVADVTTQARTIHARSLLLLADEVELKDPNAQLLTRFGSLGGKSFDPAIRYAFGFDVVVASEAARRMNLDAAASADYADMIAKGQSMLYVGTAAFKGVDCKSSDASYDWSVVPTRVHFRLGFKTPTSYRNCQNTDLKGKAFAGEEAQRGVQVADVSSLAQLTFHIEHPFWHTVDHDAAELYFDQMAVAANQDGELSEADLSKLDFTSFKDQAGRDLPWRSCLTDKAVKTGVRKFDSGSVPVNPTAAPESALRSYADYVAYQQSTQGHLNADGLCAIQRHFAAPR